MTPRPRQGSASSPELGFLLLTTFLNFVGFSLLVPILPFIVARYVHDPAWVAPDVGLLLGAYALCSFVAAPVLGGLSDRFGRRPVLLVSLLGSVIGYVVFALGGSLVVLFAGRIIDGLTAGNMSTINAYLADVTEPDERARTYGMVGAATGLGFMTGPAIGGLAARVDLSAPVWIAAGVVLLDLVWGAAVLRESLAPADRVRRLRSAQLNPLGQLGNVLRAAPVRRSFGAGFLFLLAFAGLEAITPVYARDLFGWDVQRVAVLLVVAGLCSVVTQGMGVRLLLRRIGEHRTASLGLTLAIVGLAIAALTSLVGAERGLRTVLIYAGITVFIVGDGLFEPSNRALVANSAGRTEQGRVQGSYQALASMTRIIGPLLGAALYGLAAGLPYASEAVLAGLALLAFGAMPFHLRREGPRPVIEDEPMADA